MCVLCCGGDQQWARRIRMREQTLLTVVAGLAVVAAELAYLKSGIFATAQYWCTMLIIFASRFPSVVGL
jgi:hypothetical protein